MMFALGGILMSSASSTARVAALHDDLDAAELGGGGPRVGDLPVLGLRLDAEMTLDPGDRVDDDSSYGHGRLPLPRPSLGRSRAASFAVGSGGRPSRSRG